MSLKETGSLASSMEVEAVHGDLEGREQRLLAQARGILDRSQASQDIVHTLSGPRADTCHKR